MFLVLPNYVAFIGGKRHRTKKVTKTSIFVLCRCPQWFGLALQILKECHIVDSTWKPEFTIAHMKAVPCRTGTVQTIISTGKPVHIEPNKWISCWKHWLLDPSLLPINRSLVDMLDVIRHFIIQQIEVDIVNCVTSDQWIIRTLMDRILYQCRLMTLG